MKTGRILLGLAALGAVFATLFWREPALDAPSSSTTERQPKRAARPERTEAAPGRPVTIAPTAAEIETEEADLEVLKHLASGFGRLMILCPDPSLASTDGVRGLHVVSPLTPLPMNVLPMFPAQVNGRGLSVVVPTTPGTAQVRVEGVGLLRVSWTVDGPDSARCAEMAWVARAVGVYGVVRDGQGHPVGGAVVRGCSAHAFSDEEGEFFLEAQIDERCELEAIVSRGAAQSSSVPVEIASTGARDVTGLVLTVEDLPAAPAQAGAEDLAAAQALRRDCKTPEAEDLANMPNRKVMELYVQPLIEACAVALAALDGGADAAFAEQLVNDQIAPGGIVPMSVE